MSVFDTLRARLGGRGPRRLPTTPRALEAVRVGRPALSLAAPVAREEGDLPKFRSSANDQIDSRTAGPLAAIRVRLRAAFTPSQPVQDRRIFAGRGPALQALIGSIEDQRLHVVLHGERGIGKTSTLNILAQAAREARYLVIHMSCGEHSTFDEVFRAIAAQIPLLFHSAYGPTHAESERGGTLADILPAGPLSTRAAADALGRITGTRVLVILDEFDRCEATGFRQAIAELMKDLSDRAVRVQFVIAGVAANLTELLEHVPSIQRNVFALALPKMSRDEVRQMVSKGEEASGLNFDDQAIEQVVSMSVGFPYLASLLSHHAGLLALDEDTTHVTGSQVARAADVALGELKGRISRRSQLQIDEAVGHGGLKALSALASAAQSTGGRFTVDDIGAASGDGEDKAVHLRLVETLADEGMLIEAAEDEYGRRFRFIEPSVPAYLWLLSGRGRMNVAPPSPPGAFA